MIKSLRPVIIFGILLTLSATAFQTRQNNFIKSDSTTIDEEVYYILGHQIKSNWRNYNTIEYANWLQAEKDFSLPDYFYRPLFKHPPFFPFLISLSVRLFGDNLVSAVYVSGFFGALLVPLGYLLGHLAGGWIVGILAAVLIWLDPVNMICSQKIWLDTPLAFFMVLSVYFYLKACTQNRANFFIYAGIAAGLATLTKYPGILAILAIYLSALLTRPHLMKDRKFLFSLTIPLLMSLPWLGWNVAVYGNNVFSEIAGIHSFLPQYMHVVLIVFLMSVILLFPILVQLGKRMRFGGNGGNLTIPLGSRRYLRLGVSIFFACLLLPAIVKALRLDILPATSWEAGLFVKEDSLFYLCHLLEFSLFYVFSFISWTRLIDDRNELFVTLRVTSLLIITFYSIWGAYQSRYILPALPVLTILAAHEWVNLFQKVNQDQRIFYRLGMQGFLLFVLVFSAYKMGIINTIVSTPNDMCYF